MSKEISLWIGKRFEQDEERESFDLYDFSKFLQNLSNLYAKITLINDDKFQELFDFAQRKRFNYLSERERLTLHSVNRQNPIKVDIGGFVPKAIEAFANLLERIVTLPEYKHQKRLENKAKEVEIVLDVVKTFNKNLEESKKIAIANELLFDINKLIQTQNNVYLSKVEMTENENSKIRYLGTKKDNV